ncbi:MAG: heavy metal translocating P-type ATPase [Pseudomonadota bacterium]
MSATAACPGCLGGDAATATAGPPPGMPTHALLLPTIQCLDCMRQVEATLMRQPGINAARVNLSRKRVTIAADAGADPTAWITALDAAGFEAHEARDTVRSSADNGLLLRLGVAGFAMMNVMLLSVAVWSGAADATRDLFHWVAALIAIPAALFCAQPFFHSARRSILAGHLNMDVPISLAIVLACALSLYETWTGGAHAYFDAALSLTFFLLAGRVMESRMRRVARSAAADLAALEPQRVSRVENGARVSRAIDDIAVGDTIWLTAGSRIPVDGVLTSDRAELDRSALTGESDPIEVSRGAALCAGEIALTGPVTVRASVVGENSTLRRMVNLAALAEASRTRYTALADRAARLYAPLVHGLAFAAFLGWLWISGDLHKAAMIAISTLIITCPCALGLAVPAVSTVATGRLFRLGALIKSDTALERLADIDVVFFDKTGTLSENRLDVPDTLSASDLSILKTLAGASMHPLSRSLLPQLSDVPEADLSDIEEIAGQGVAARCGNRDVRLGSGAWLGARSGTALRIGDRVIALSRSERAVPEAAALVATLKKQGLPVHLLTGDRADHASRLAGDLGVNAVHADALPADKLRLVEATQASGHHVLMVGDGLNDTLALSAAWASMAPGNALEASQNAADIVLLSGRLKAITDAMRIARSAKRRILENFGMAATYNAIAIPICLMGYATPLMAALAMSSSSVLVTLNALRVR